MILEFRDYYNMTVTNRSRSPRPAIRLLIYIIMTRKEKSRLDYYEISRIL